MKTKLMICGSLVLSSMALTASDTPEVSDVVMSQASFGRMVTVTYKLSNASSGAVVTFDVETNCTVNGETKWASIGGEAVCNARGAVWRKVTSADADDEGKYTITWRPDLSWEGHKVSLADGGARAVVTAWALDNTPDYMVVDISASAKANTQRYYPAVEFLPGAAIGQEGAITNNPAYKTSMIVMRKIMAKGVTWIEGGLAQHVPSYWQAQDATHQVELTSNYYISVFPVTQGQWTEVWPKSSATATYKTEGAMRPMECVSYNEIRLSSSYDDMDVTHDWPQAPSDGSFLGLLRKKTGIDFDLPSEAQWEFAARAGNGSGYWNDGSPILTLDNNTRDTNLDRLARYRFTGGKTGESYNASPSSTCGPENATAIVGSYEPNSWGIYDASGNVWEWCLDFNAKASEVVSLYGSVNTVNSDGSKILRGGAWSVEAPACNLSRRCAYAPDSRYGNCGLRVVCTAGLE